jgi:Xaa-Pro aminopeptidase
MPQIKKSHEIQKIQEACRITDRIFGKMRKYLSHKTHITEKQLEVWLLAQIQAAGCTPSFHPIIAAWANAAHPHWKADNTVLHGFVVIDFGVVYQRYMSDMTRTIYVGTPSEEEKKLYSLVLKAQEDSMQYIKPWRYYKDAHRVAAATLGEHKKYFIHSLGHGIWTVIHEKPRISPKGTWWFKPHMCVTVEPWVYIEGKLGIRIEDTCLVTENGCEQITKSTKKLLCF